MVFLVAAGVVVPLVHRLKVSPVLGFLVVGMVIGPHGLVRFADTFPWLHYILIDDVDGVRHLAHLGVVFLLFMIGLELSVDRLWAMRRMVFGLGGAQVVLTSIVITMIALLFENNLPMAVVIGCGFALSSTAIVMQLLSEGRRLGTAAGRTSFSILLFQDLAVLPILLLVGGFAAQDDGSVVLAFVWAMAQALIAVAIILVVGRLVIRPLFRFVGSDASREMFIAFVLLVIIGTALATEEAGLSMALGAFLAGLLFAETEYRHEIEVDIEPFKGLLLGLFFASVGMTIDLADVVDKLPWLIASVIGLYLVKGVIIYALARLFGDPRSVALEVSLLLGQGGEFAFLIIGLAFSLALIPNDTAQFMLIVTSLTMLVTPMVAQLARELAKRVQSREAAKGQEDADIPADLTGHTIVVGYGRVGQTIGTLLDDQELPHIGVDFDGALVSRFRDKGAAVFYGDASRPEMLRRFGADRAGALVVTLDDPAAAQHIVVTARQHWPDLPIYARAHDAKHAAQLVAHGASHVVPEILEVSLELGEMLLVNAGVPGQAARRMVETHRHAEQTTIDAGRSPDAG